LWGGAGRFDDAVRKSANVVVAMMQSLSMQE